MKYYYKKSDAVRDFIQLLPRIQSYLVKHDVLTKCVVCLKPLNSQDERALIYDDYSSGLGIACQYHHPQSTWHINAAFPIIPDNSYERLLLINNLIIVALQGEGEAS